MSRTSLSIAGTSYSASFTREIITLNSETSIPTESIPLSLASTSVVPEPLKGSSTVCPGSKYLDKK